MVLAGVASTVAGLLQLTQTQLVKYVEDPGGQEEEVEEDRITREEGVRGWRINKGRRRRR